MPEFFTAETVKEKPFLFISYSHSNKELTSDLARYLLDEGVRLWYDKDLAPGDPWSEKVKELIEHPNCSGVILVCSPLAFVSDNVHKERETALKAQEERGTKNFQFFQVNVCDDVATGSSMCLLKQTFDQLEMDTIDKDFPVDRFDVLMRIIGKDSIDVKTADENCFADLLNGILKNARAVVDKDAVALENLQQVAGLGGISVTLGNYNGPLRWQFVSSQGENGIFLLQKPLDAAFGKELDFWLNNEFLRTAFSEEESQLLADKIRLLTVKETEFLNKNDLRVDVAWWLQDCANARQAEITTDGVISPLRQLNYRFKRGVRPVIVLKIEDVTRLIND
ncbi:MAG: toll/interleukin-1 receptor domain-containing protein [Ruminococcaceae bacterium]|nr:toll/interleukin-1 receptor domain-containing protein [Oscillospiraceae bacterium]